VERFGAFSQQVTVLETHIRESHAAGAIIAIERDQIQYKFAKNGKKWSPLPLGLETLCPTSVTQIDTDPFLWHR
jgi:hypothetical protein